MLPDFDTRHGEARRRVEPAPSRAQGEAAGGDGAQSAPCGVRGLEYLLHDPSCRQVAFPRHSTPVLVLHFDGPSGELVDEHADALQEVQGLEAGHDTGDAIVFHDLEVGRCADDRADVAGAEKTVELELAGIEEGAHGGREQLMGGKDGEVPDVRGGSLSNRRRNRRGGRLEAYAQKDDMPVGVFDGDAQGIEAGVDDAHIRSLAPFVVERRLGARHPQQVAEGGDDHARLPGQPDGPVDVLVGRDAHRAPRSADELDGRREKLPQSCPEYGHRVRSADFHESGLTADRSQPLQRRQQVPGQLRVPVFVEILQCVSSLIPNVNAFFLFTGPVVFTSFGEGTRGRPP